MSKIHSCEEGEEEEEDEPEDENADGTCGDDKPEHLCQDGGELATLYD